MEKIVLDATDRALLRLLQRDASLSLAALAESVHLTTSPCWKRLKRLEECGVITARVALLDAERVGLGLTAFVQLKTRDHSRAWFERFVAVIEEIEEVTEFYRMAGDYDYLLKVQVADMNAYDRVYKQLVNTLDDLTDVSARFAMECLKSTTALPV
ncbi:Lrp/AsnC family transcriptional regulator [Cobetia marina]|jgi:Lrp/AsnC family transcriptional regulator|uniref:Lrp/AsnC family transcriptional regulator n=1 Tax=Cobetia marina TaxID=28258 RepID=A0ABU9GIB1_COBMA|nr:MULTISPECIES: Lrp/AsnC family transcriptional regulator [Cobetia]AZV32550.1 Lrp/AsnC family transcriptional regulator [Cobetia sp. ICG0124]MDO6788852.1 Lrp/AsnC family transcriptional regulator [Cobetia marina]TKD63197.1 Lrp/AsnC family transcriptional regulator [Cobetia marina]GED43526.1 transcriptional regulator [Cobetia marina]